MPRGFKDLAALAAQKADQKKGEEIRLLDVHRISGITDYILLVNVLSSAHLEAIENEIGEMMGIAGLHLLHRDGSDSVLWRVLDYGGLIVHLMHPQAREFYQLDKLYHDAPHRQWLPQLKSRARSRAKKNGS